jgi:hypothetical protein
MDMDPRQAVCVTLAAGDSSPAFGPLWRITFYMDTARGLQVAVDDRGNTIAGSEFSGGRVPFPPACRRAF